MNIALIIKSPAGMQLSLYDDSLALIESESCGDVYTLYIHQQNHARNYRHEQGLQVVQEKGRNAVDLSIARDENSFFVS